MTGRVTPLHHDDDEDSVELDGDGEWLGTEALGMEGLDEDRDSDV